MPINPRVGGTTEEEIDNLVKLPPVVRKIVITLKQNLPLQPDKKPSEYVVLKINQIIASIRPEMTPERRAEIVAIITGASIDEEGWRARIESESIIAGPTGELGVNVRMIPTYLSDP